MGLVDVYGVTRTIRWGERPRANGYPFWSGMTAQNAKLRPQESLGVIALGSPHADAIEAGILGAIADRTDLEEFFSEEKEERFFVKNLERVQGDERDAIILAIGYGKNPDGSLPHRFGPLNNQGGERRLNVAVTRAKRRMTVISSFTERDVDPTRSKASGVLLLKAFLDYAATGGEADETAFDGMGSVLHRMIEQALTASGHEVIVAPGASADRLDLAVVDPDTGVPVVAIDIDGPGYAGRPSVRDRDRLRPEQLSRLGWEYVSTWSQDWYRDTESARASIVEKVESALLSVKKRREISPDENQAPPEPVVGPNAHWTPVTRTRFEPSIRPPKPGFNSGGPSITDWSHADLVQLAAWIETDGVLRTEDELLTEMMSELGISRRGSRVVATLQAAIKALRASE